MPELNFTPEQRAAIDTRGSTVLVSAAAGSGKTRVLTERLMAYLTDAENPVDIDRFLVITYTRAAAAELRSRILDGIYARIASDPENRRLRRQVALCARAEIGTIHSFCADFLRANCAALALAPDFQVADTERCAALRATALLFAYAFVHYDAETEANTYQVTTHLTDYALFTSRHGGITLQLSTEAGVFYYDVFYDSSPWNAVKEEERALTETLQPLADCRAEITVVVSDEKNYAYVTSYGLDALQAVEVRDAEGILFSRDGHNQDQKVRRIETIIAAGLLLVGFAAYRAVKRFLGA